MKKATIILFMAVAVYACGRKTVATASSPTPAAETPAATTKTEPTTTTSKTDPAAAATSLATKVAEGQVVYTNRCGRCHALKPVGAYTTTEWTGILQSMIPKAKLDAMQSEQVTAYVMSAAKK